MAIFFGGVSIERLTGTDAADVLWGVSGDLYHTVYLIGNGGDDTIIGGVGSDHIFGGAGADYIDGRGGYDTADWQMSPSAVYIDLMANQAFGGDAEGDTIINIETIIGSYYNDTIIGDDGDNYINSFGGNNTYIGNGGDDHFHLYDGVHFVDGGAGFDSVTYAVFAPIHINLHTHEFSGGAEGSEIINVEKIHGSIYGGDYIYGDSQNNWFDGSGFNGDYFNGYLGDDTLTGGHGDDTILGGGGDDSIAGGYGGKLWANGNAGNDTVFAGDGYLESDSHIKGDSILHGGKGDDLISGAGGNDILFGDLGNDTLYGNIGADIFVFNAANSGIDTIADFVSGVDMIELHNSSFISSSEAVDAFVDGVLDLGGGNTISFTGVNSLSIIDINII